MNVSFSFSFIFSLRFVFSTFRGAGNLQKRNKKNKKQKNIFCFLMNLLEAFTIEAQFYCENLFQSETEFPRT